jgi:hypothetical protein
MFAVKTSIHLRVRLDEDGEQRLAALREQRRGRRCRCTSAKELLASVSYAQPIALAAILATAVLLVVFRQPRRCDRCTPQCFCCRATWPDEASADKWLLLSLVLGLPLAALSWFAFDDADKLDREWAAVPGYAEPVAVDMVGWGRERRPSSATGHDEGTPGIERSA